MVCLGHMYIHRYACVSLSTTVSSIAYGLFLCFLSAASVPAFSSLCKRRPGSHKIKIAHSVTKNMKIKT